MKKSFKQAVLVIGAVAAVSLGCETTTTSTPAAQPPADPNGCTYNNRYYPIADYPNGFLAEDGCRQCRCSSDGPGAGCVLTCVGDNGDPVGGPSRLSVDRASCKLTEERYDLDDSLQSWTMTVAGVCDATAIRLVLRGAVVESYPQHCDSKSSPTVEGAVTIGGATATPSGAGSCTMQAGPKVREHTTWPTFFATASDGTKPYTIAYQPPREKR